MSAMAHTALWTKLRTAAPFFLITGPNVLQGKDHALRIAEHIAKLKEEFSLETVFKVTACGSCHARTLLCFSCCVPQTFRFRCSCTLAYSQNFFSRL